MKDDDPRNGAGGAAESDEVTSVTQAGASASDEAAPADAADEAQRVLLPAIESFATLGAVRELADARALWRQVEGSDR